MTYPTVDPYLLRRYEQQKFDLLQRQTAAQEAQAGLAAVHLQVAGRSFAALSDLVRQVDWLGRQFQVSAALQAAQLDTLDQINRRDQLRAEQGQLQDRLEEFIYAWGKALAAFRDPDSPVPALTQYLVLGGLFAELARGNLTTASIAGLERKREFDRCRDDSLDLYRDLGRQPEVQEALALAARERERQEQEQRVLAERQAEEDRARAEREATAASAARQEQERRAAAWQAAATAAAQERRRMLQVRDELVAERTRKLAALPPYVIPPPPPQGFRETIKQAWQKAQADAGRGPKPPTAPDARVVAHAFAADLGLYDVIDGRLGFESPWLEKAVRHVLEVMHPVHGKGGVCLTDMTRLICDKVIENAFVEGAGWVDWGRPPVSMASDPLTLLRTLSAQWGGMHQDVHLQGDSASFTDWCRRYVEGKQQELAARAGSAHLALPPAG